MTSNQVSTQPIIDMSFEGLHWIEASAGTGKTYTLSSLMVRILLEKYLPNQIIATTFTRKAAAELKSRVRLRLVETQQFFESCRELTEAEILSKADQITDPLYRVLLKHFSSQIGYACERLKLVIDQLDELFVGTLDSFSQKLLREFAFESGKIEYVTITDDAKQYSYQLIHDVLREWIQLQSQPTIDYLLLNKKLKSQDAYVAVVESSLNFSSAYFQEVKAPVLNLKEFEAEIARFKALDLAQVQTLSEYYLAEGQYSKVVAKKWRDAARMQTLLEQSLAKFIDAIKQQDIYAIFSPQFAQTFKALRDLSTGKVLNKCPEDVLVSFENHTVIQTLKMFCMAVDKLHLDLDQLDSFLKYHLSNEVKKRLPQVLQQKGETTFAQQIRTLAEALKGKQGQRFASYVHARYPLILVDEFQDTNQDQDDMLAQIWRHPNRISQGCMIMVGDRKQAIYGFRGGDMLTFLKAHQDVFGKSGHAYNLIENHRSVQPLVEVVDALFQRQPDFGEQVTYMPVQAGHRPHPALIDMQQTNPAPLRWMQLEQKETEAEQVAWKIRELLNQAIQTTLSFGDDQNRPLIESDLAVLSKNHSSLDKVQSALEFLGIAVNRPSKRSVFESQVARDIGAMLTAIMYPFDEGKIKRALLSRLMGFNLQQLIQLELQADGLSAYIEQFDLIRNLWLQQGFLTAWQYALNQFNIWTNLVDRQSRDNERTVVNLRHLTEVLSQHSESYPGAQNLYHWYLKQLTTPLQREWEMERKLSSDAGVQLMTIHQSKGLEFKIVFLLDADSPVREMNKTLNFSKAEIQNLKTGQLEQRRVVAINDPQALEDTAIEQHNERNLAEHRRLWYVALTRASHRVYAMMSDSKGTSSTGLAFWRGHGADAFQHPSSMQEPLLLEKPQRIKAAVSELKIDIVAQKYPTQRFYPRSKTSFSYLAQHLTRQQIQDALAVLEVEQGGAEDESQMTLAVPEVVENQQPIAWIKAHFPMGTVAGNFLHEIFEYLDFQNSSNWAVEIKRRFKNEYSILRNELIEKSQKAFPEHSDHDALCIEFMLQWLKDVLTTPIFNDFQLIALGPQQHLVEFPFYLALSDRVLAIQRIHQLFGEYGIVMPEFKEANSARYLKGEIDLIYFDGQQYHIADYKSNFLGTSQENYRHSAIKDSMSHASYWLQAALYLVALHRYLKVQLLDYDMQRDLGGATYLYLRGMNGQPEQGYFYWKPENEFILRLDAILGYFAEDKSIKIA